MDLKRQHAREFSNLEAGPNAGAVGFWFRAVQAGDLQLASDVWDATIMVEHYVSLLDNDVALRTPEEISTAAVLLANAKALQAKVDAVASARGVVNFPSPSESHQV